MSRDFDPNHIRFRGISGKSENCSDFSVSEMRTIQPPEAPTYQHDQSEQFLLGGPDPGNEPWVIVDVTCGSQGSQR